LLVATSLVGAACDSNDNGSPFAPTPGGGSASLSNFVITASIDGIAGQMRSGAIPAESGGPVIDVTGNSTIVNGGTSALTVTGGAALRTIYVAMAGTSMGLANETAGGFGGYFEVANGSSASMASLVLAFSQQIPTSPFDLFLAAEDESGAVGPFTTVTFNALQVGTGDVQVTLSWDSDSDVDLHVVDPSGEEVYWANRTSASGGELDLDSNAGCSIDDVRNENITWPVGTAPQGSYTVRVDYWSSCGVSETNYTVLVNNGGDVQIFSGTFTGSGDNGGLGSGTEIVVFERTTGPAPARANPSSLALPAGPTRK
jgi:hypothetical protein